MLISVETRCGGGVAGCCCATGFAVADFFLRLFFPSPFPMNQKLLLGILKQRFCDQHVVVVPPTDSIVADDVKDEDSAEDNGPIS